MKYNITEVDYYNSEKPKAGSGWWTWTEFCDGCNIKTIRFGERIMKKSEYINIKSKDFCVKCLRESLK